MNPHEAAPRSAPTGDRPALSRARAAALAELRRAPLARPWRREAVVFATSLAVITVVVGAAAATVAMYSPERFLVKAGPIALLLVTQVVGAWAAVAPSSRRFAWATLGLGVVALAAAVAGHVGETTASPLPGWVCSTSHLAIGIVPLFTALAVVRRGAFRWDRALAAGVAAGAMGALMGELCCERGAVHTAVQHGGAWLAVALAVAVAARLLRPRTFAP